MTTIHIEKLYAQEGRNPWSIKNWLLNLGYDSHFIDIALDAHARLLAAEVKFGYKDGISVLSNSIRQQVIDLTLGKVKETSEVSRRFKVSKKKDKGFLGFLKKW